MNYLYNLPKSFKPKFKFDLIRLGRNNDGGYLVGKNTIKNTEILLSFGIFDDWSFEKDFQKKNKLSNILMFDNQLDNLFLLKRLISQKYIKQKLISIKNLLEFNFSMKKKTIKKKITQYEFESILRKFKKNIFIKIDIEGDEYQLLKKIIKYKKKLSGIAIEFHLADINIKRISSFFGNLNFFITNVHINNYEKYGKNLRPKVIEITLEKNPRILKYTYKYDNYLNQKNNVFKKEAKICFI